MFAFILEKGKRSEKLFKVMRNFHGKNRSNSKYSRLYGTVNK